MKTKEFLSLFGEGHLFSAYDYQKIMPPIGNIKDIKELRKLNREGYCIFFSVNRFKNGKRLNKNIKSVRTIWVDDDKPRFSARKNWPLPPSIIVRTSSHDHNGKLKYKIQYYWLTETTAYNEFELVMQTMIDKHGNDKGVRDLARVLRLPGFNHNKDIDNPFKVKVIGGSFKFHSWDKIKIAFPMAKEIKGSTKHAGKYSKEKARIAIKGSDDYHGSLRDRAMELANKRMDTDEIIAILRSDMEKVPEKERDKRWQDRNSEDHLYECANSAVKKYESEEHESEIQLEDIEQNAIHDEEYIYGGRLKDRELAPKNTVIGDLTKAIMNSWWKPNIMVASLSAKAFVAYLAGGNYRGSVGDRVNLQQIAVGDSGSGKDPLISSAANLIQIIFLHDKKMMSGLLRGILDEVGSAEGLDDRIRSMEDKHDILMVKDEIGELLSRAASGDQVKAGILNYILKMYTKSDGISNERAKAKKKGQQDETMLYAPSFTVSAATTPELIVDGLSASNVGTGLMSRVMMFNVDNYVGLRVREVKPIKLKKKTIQNMMKIVDTSMMVGDEFSMPSARVYNPKIVKFDEEVIDYCYEQSLEDDNRKGSMRAVWNRRVPNAKKYAMIEAIAENPDRPVVDMKMIKRSMKFVTNSCEYTILLFENNVGENINDLAAKDVIRILLKYKGKWVKRQTLCNSRKVKKLRGVSDFNFLLKSMVDSGQIEHGVKSQVSGGRASNLYRLINGNV